MPTPLDEVTAQMYKRFEKVYAFVKQGLYDSALDLLYNNQTQRINPQFKFDANHAWYNVGNVFYHQGEYRRAIGAFKKALRTRIDDVDALWAIGNCYADMNSPKLAERYFHKAVAFAPDKWVLMYNLGNSLFDQGKYRDAVDFYMRIPASETDLFGAAKKNMQLAQDKMRRKNQ